uniref:Histone-binding protein RBBP4 N-terminal domain-containing protein n=1 Tax=Entomoneis paludosa TaxID=265537 RepID=A0A7S2YH96_9STRA
MDPVVEHYSIKHYGGVNRVRCMPQQQNIVATWSDTGKVNLFNVESILQRFAASSGKGALQQSEIPSKPFFSYTKHRTEGYAIDWSRVKQGQLLSGDCEGDIHLWTPREDGGGYTVTPSYHANEKTKNTGGIPSVEDLQWSPTEATVFASAECGGYIRVFDIRAPGRSMLNHQVHENGSDVNVLSWNHLVTNLIASGSDDGVMSVWDLRKFSGDNISPLARFTPHQSPISSVEWHPTDESMVAVTDDMGAYIYDLSVEEDESAMTPGKLDIPPQLLFVHSGSEQFKEVHWHPQISSCLMTTAVSGYSAFIPSNL